MDKISESLENLKTIYLNEIHKDISLELEEEIVEARKSQGFEKMTFWKSFAEKWLFVVAQRTPDLFEVFNRIFNDVIDIVEEGKEHMQDRWDVEKKCFNEKISGLLRKIKSLEEDVEIGECKKKSCAEEKAKLQKGINKLTLKCENIQKIMKNAEDYEEILKEVQDLQGKAEDYEGVIRDLREQIREDAEIINEVQDLRGKVEDYKKANRDFRKQMRKDAEIINKVQDLRGKVEDYERVISDLREQTRKDAEIINEIQDLRVKVEDYERVISDLREQARKDAEIINEVQDLRRKVENYERVINDLREQTRRDAEIISEVQDLRGKVEDYEKVIIDLREQTRKDAEIINEIQDLRVKVEDYERVIIDLKKQIREDAEIINEVQDLRGKVEEYEKILNNLREKIQNDAEIINELKETNEECIKLAQSSKVNKESINDMQLTKLKKENTDLLIQNNDLLEQLTEFQLGAQPSLEKILNYSKTTASSSVCNLKTNDRKNIIPKQPSKKQILKTRIAQSRELTLKQLKETIDEIYLSKIKFDEKCFETNQPRETMDQFLHTYLNQKYGLKILIVEWSVLILKATEKFESSDSEVSLFSKILSHRVEEDFRFTFEKLKEKIKQTLKSLIQQQNPYMREIQISSLLKEKMSGILSPYEWESIVYGILSKDESGFLVDTINALTEQKESKLVIGKRNKLVVEKNEPTFGEVQNALLKYDLAAHETLLEPFWKIFNEEDRDNNGILNEDEFKGLCNRVNLEGEVERLLDLVDPDSSGFINFSDCVNLFSFEMVDNGEQNPISVVHFLFFNSQSL